ncbi:MAG TPA: hypothetical protein VGD68_05295 [Streptosporangiaceae bacterium]
MTAVAGSLTAVVILLSAQGCGTTADATTDAVGPTPAAALKVFNAYVTANKVAVANRDQLLAESLTSSAQYSVLASQYDVAASTGVPVTSPRYGQPKLYVPKLTTYPQWFVAAVPEYPSHGGRAGTAVMVFDRTGALSGWTLDDAVQLAGGVPALNVAVDHQGYATALPTTDGSLEVPPDEVGATHASVVDDGPSSPAAKVVAAGAQTTGIYRANAAYAAKIRPGHWIYAWQMEGTSYPFFALRTTDGGAIVFYTMALNEQTWPAIKPPAHPKVRPPSIPVPDVYKPLLEAGQAPFVYELDAGSTLQFLTTDPPAPRNGATPGKLVVVGSGGGLTYAGGS